MCICLSCIWLFCHICVCLNCKSWYYTQDRDRKGCDTEFNKFICFHNFLLRNVELLLKVCKYYKILIFLILVLRTIHLNRLNDKGFGVSCNDRQTIHLKKQKIPIQHRLKTLLNSYFLKYSHCYFECFAKRSLIETYLRPHCSILSCF